MVSINGYSMHNPMSKFKSAGHNVPQHLPDILDVFGSDIKRTVELRYGLTGEPQTLQSIGDEQGLTRERVRQKVARTMEYLREIIDQIPDAPFIQVAQKSAAILQALDTRDSASFNGYSASGVLRLMADCYPEQYEIFNEGLSTELFIEASQKSRVIAQRDEVVEVLGYQEGYVGVDELALALDVPISLVASIANCHVADGLIAIRSNANIFPSAVGKTEQALREFGRPATVAELVEKLDFGERQVRSYLERSAIAINVGPSTYALREWDYVPGTIADVIEYYLRIAEEPLALKQIRRLVANQRTAPGASLYAHLADGRFQRVEAGYYALREWGYETEFTPQKRSYKYQSDQIILEILRAARTALSIRGIIEFIAEKYLDQSSTNYITIQAALKRLERSGQVQRLTRGRNNYYQRIDSAKSKSPDHTDDSTSTSATALSARLDEKKPPAFELVDEIELDAHTKLCISRNAAQKYYIINQHVTSNKYTGFTPGVAVDRADLQFFADKLTDIVVDGAGGTIPWRGAPDISVKLSLIDGDKVDIRQWYDTPKYTGYTKKGIRISKQNATMLLSMLQRIIKSNGASS